MKLIAMTSIVFLLSGCASFKIPWERAISSEPAKMKSYSIDEEITTFVGDPLLTASNGRIHKRYYPVSDKITLWGNRSITLFDNNSHSLSHKWEIKYNFDGLDGDYILTSKGFHRDAIGIIINEDGTSPENPVLRVDKRGSTKRYPINMPYESNKVFTKLLVPADNGYFKFELIYTGRTDNKINIVYREYKDDLARSSFYQNLSYDLNESDLIRFKSLKIKILEANNSDITFKVISDDNLSWL